MPSAKTSRFEPSGFIRRMADIIGRGRQTLHGAPTDMYSRSSGPKLMNFHVWPSFGFGKLSRTTTGAGGESRCRSMSSNRRSLLLVATYSAPFRIATPLGQSRPLAITTTRSALWSPLVSTIAWTLPANCDPTNTVPCGPSAIDRAPSTLSAKTVTWNPGGTTHLLGCCARTAVTATDAACTTTTAAIKEGLMAG